MKKYRYPILICAAVGIGLLHFLTPGHLLFYHDTYRRLGYFPIALGGIWFGVRGGLSIAALTSVAFIPHLLLFIGKGRATYLSELTEIVLYLAAGILIGSIAGKESKLREKYRLLSEKLKNSYAKLHEQTELMIEVEEQFRKSQKLAVIGEVSASLAHEIKNPLGSIKGSAEILLDDFPVGHPKREFVEILLTETSRLDTSVNEVLHLLRGRQPESIEFATESLSTVLRRCFKLLSGEVEKKKIRLDCTGLAAGESFPVAGEKISQIFINILLNAVDASPQTGNIGIHVERLDKGGILVQIKDDGPGIKDGDLEKIFDPFFTHKEDGTGLGLPISRKIAESHGGRLKAVRIDDGACFELFLPEFHG